MNNLFIQQSKKSLGTNIEYFIRNNYTEKGRRARLKFAEEVNALLNVESDDDANYKKVSRWICGESFPDLITIVAISKVMNKSINELFSEAISCLSRTKSLNQIEKDTLKSLIKNETVDSCSTIYIPYAFQENPVYNNKVFFTRKEIIDFYKHKATAACRIDRLRDYYRLLKKGTNLTDEKHFARFCSVAFIENLSEESREPIFYTNEDDYYEKMKEIWKEATPGENFDNKDFFNVVFFEERSFDYNTFFNVRLDKAYYFMQKGLAESIYNQYLLGLIEKGFIQPCEPEYYSCEWDDGYIDSGYFEKSKNLTVFTDDDYDYNLDTISFSFKLNLNNAEKVEILSY